MEVNSLVQRDGHFIFSATQAMWVSYYLFPPKTQLNERRFSLQCYTLASIVTFRKQMLNLTAPLTHFLASPAMLYYDHIITLPQEVQNIWKRDLGFVSALFLVNRT